MTILLTSELLAARAIRIPISAVQRDRLSRLTIGLRKAVDLHRQRVIHSHARLRPDTAAGKLLNNNPVAIRSITEKAIFDRDEIVM